MGVSLVAIEENAWDRIVDEWSSDRGTALLRAYSDEVHRRLFTRWPLPRASRLLKTDLFDEVVGDGIYPILARFADTVTAVDISENVVAAARRRYPGLHAIACDVRAMPFADESFDVIVSNSTLDHFETSAGIEAGLTELARVLRPGGRLVVSLDNPTNPLIALRNALPNEPLERSGLVPYFVGATLDRAGLAAALAAVGLTVEASTAIMHAPRIAGRAIAPVVSDGAVNRVARALGRLEWLGQLPTRYLTGQFVVCRAVRPPS